MVLIYYFSKYTLYHHSDLNWEIPFGILHFKCNVFTVFTMVAFNIFLFLASTKHCFLVPHLLSLSSTVGFSTSVNSVLRTPIWLKCIVATSVIERLTLSIFNEDSTKVQILTAFLFHSLHHVALRTTLTSITCLPL